MSRIISIYETTLGKQFGVMLAISSLVAGLFSASPASAATTWVSINMTATAVAQSDATSPTLDGAYGNPTLADYASESKRWYACDFPLAAAAAYESGSSGFEGQFNGSGTFPLLETFAAKPVGATTSSLCLSFEEVGSILDLPNAHVWNGSEYAAYETAQYGGVSVKSSYPFVIQANFYSGSTDLIAVSNSVATHPTRELTWPTPTQSGNAVSFGAGSPITGGLSANGRDIYVEEGAGWFGCTGSIALIFSNAKVTSISKSGSSLVGFNYFDSIGQTTSVCRHFENTTSFSDTLNLTGSKIYSTDTLSYTSYDASLQQTYDHLVYARLFYLNDGVATTTAHGTNVYAVASAGVDYVAPASEPADPNSPNPPSSPTYITGLTRPLLSIDGGTSIGDTVTVATAPTWDTELINENSDDQQYSWLYAQSCEAESWMPFTVNGSQPTGSDFTIPAEITVDGAQLSADGLAFLTVAEFSNSAENVMGYSGSVAFEVGGGFCSTQDQAAPAATEDVVRANPYRGPVVTGRSLDIAPSGTKVVLSGSGLSGVTSVEIGGLEVDMLINEEGQIELTVPVELTPGTYDLLIVSDSGRLTIQDGFVVGKAQGIPANFKPSTKLMPDETVKVRVFNPAGAGKVQVFVNGKEIAWVQTDDPQDPKLHLGYLVRTVDLQPGKNVIEIYVDGERVRRTAYTK